MRAVVAGIALGLLLSGCQSPDKSRKPDDKKPGTSDRKGAPEQPQITPVNILSGRVLLVNAPLRYVVIGFGVGRLPQPGQRLDVYRQGKKVGEVRVSNQASAGNVAADIMLGEAENGDEIRGLPAHQ